MYKRQNLWSSFQEKIEQEYGTTYKHTSEEIENAIANYINKDIQDIEKTKTIIQNLKYENESLKSENTSLTKEIKSITTEHLKLTNENKKHTSTIDTQKSSIELLESKNLNLENKIQQLEIELNRVNILNNDNIEEIKILKENNKVLDYAYLNTFNERSTYRYTCLLYTSDAADDY